MIRDIGNPPGPSCIVRGSATCSEPSGDTTASRSLVQSSTRISTPANGTCVDEPVGTSCCEQQLLDMNISSQVAGQDPVGDFLFGICVRPRGCSPFSTKRKENRQCTKACSQTCG